MAALIGPMVALIAIETMLAWVIDHALAAGPIRPAMVAL
jgi:hypothetical protein